MHYPETEYEFAPRTYKSTKGPVESFAPDWEFTVMDAQIRNSGKLNEDLRDLVLRKEKEIVDEYEAGSDGNTDLDDGHLTKRFEYFNVFYWDHPATETLFYFFKQAYEQMLQAHNLALPMPVQIQCWANVLREGEDISEHNHANGPGSAVLSGNYCVTADSDTATVYNPHGYETDRVPIENRPGRLTVFPSWIPHHTTDFEREDDERITIAFDLSIGTERMAAFNEEGERTRQFIPFDHPPGVKERRRQTEEADERDTEEVEAEPGAGMGADD